MCGLSGHGMNRDANSGWCVQAFGRAVRWPRHISRVFLLASMLGSGLSHAQEAPAPLPEVSLAAGPVTERTGAVSTLERTGVASSSVTSVTEGTDAVFTLERTGAASEALAVMVRLSETGSMLTSRLTTAGDYEYVTVTFGVGESSTVLRAPTDDDSVMEAPSTVTAWLVPDESTDYRVGSARLARVTVTDNDTATFTVFAAPAEIAEGGTATIAVDIEGGVFAQDQPITLDFSGDSQAADYRVADNNNRSLTSPYTLILPAGETAVMAAVTALADGEAESAETVVVEARHDSVVIGTANLTIAASDAALVNEARLASLSLRNASMGAFSSDVFTYRANVGSGITYTMIRAPPTNPRATVSVSATGASLQNEGAWMVPLAPGANTVSITVTSADRRAGTTYTITVYRAVGVTAWGERDEAGDFDLLAEQGQQATPAGLWSDGEFLWVADWDTDSLLAYSLADKARRPGWDFSPLAAGSPAGMWSDGRTLWVADHHEGGIYAYSMATGVRLPDQDISLAQGNNDDPTGIWSDGDTLWVADYRDRKAYAYGLRDGARRIGADIDFNADEEAEEPEEPIHPFGMWSDGETLWVVNWLGGELRAYRLADGERLGDKDIDLSLAGNDYPMGVWSDGATLYVSDTSNTRVYAYTAVKQFAYDEALQAVPSDNALLETLSLYGVDLGGFSSEVMSYSATVDNDVNETAVEAVAVDANASLLLFGAGGTDQCGRRTVPLSVGLNVITIMVTTQTGSVNTYSVVVFRTMSLTPGDASLSFLSLSGINIGNFTSTVTDYTASAAYTVATTRVTALPADDDASVVIRAACGADGTEGRQKDVALAQGQNTITITVTAPEGTTQTYSVVVPPSIVPPSIVSPPVDPSGGVVDPPTPIPVTAVTLALSSASISENGGVSTVTATLSNVSSEATTVVVSAAAVAPAGSSDYSLSANTVLTIAAGATTSSGTVTITAVNNDVDAPDRTVTVKGAASNNLDVSVPNDLSLIIADDDVRGVMVSAATLDINEGGTGTYTVVLDSEPAGTVTVTPARSSGDSDVSVSAALSFTALTWDTLRTVTVSAGEDADALDDTAVIGHTVSGADYGGETAASVAVTVNDDELPGSLALTLDTIAMDDTVNIAEKAAGFTISGNTGSVGEVSVTVTVGGTDLSATSSAANPANWSVSVPGSASYITGASVAVAVNASKTGYDAASEVTRTLTVDLTAPVAPAYTAPVSLQVGEAITVMSPTGGSGIDGYRATGLPPGLSITNTGAISGTPDTATASTASATVTVSDSAGNTGTVQITFPAVAKGGQTLSGFQYSASSVTFGSTPPTVTRPTGAQTSLSYSATPATVCMVGLTNGGLTLVGAGSCEITAAAASTVNYNEATAVYTVTVRAAGTLVALSVAPAEVSEGAGATTVTVTATLNGGSRTMATVVTVTVGSGTAVSGTDFMAVTGFTITIAANSLSQTGAFSLRPDPDTVDEPNETVRVSGATTVPGFTVTDATLTITDNDATPTVTLALSNPSISENDGDSTVTATLSHASSVDTTVTVSVSPVSNSDYGLSSNTVLTIAAETTASTGAVTITAVDNDVDAADRMVTVRGSASNTLNVSVPTDLILTITDDDTRGVMVSETGLEIGEGGTGTYTVVLDSEPAGQVTVTPEHSSGDSDVSVSAALSFTAMTWDTPQTVTVSADEDADAVDDTAVIGHTVSGADYGSVSAATVTVTVDDNETVSTGVTLSVSPDAVSEGAGATTVTVTAALNGGSRSTDTVVTVTVGSGTAVSGTDFEAVTGFSITIAANSLSQTGAFSLRPEPDTVDEPNETVRVSGATTVPGFAVTDATLTITDNDAAPAVTLALSSTSISENGGISTVTASLDHASSENTTVTVSAAPVAPASSSDYSLSANTVLTIAAGATASSGTVTITAVNNDVDAADRTVTVMGAASNNPDVSGPGDHSLTITDDDVRGVTVSETGLEIGEGGTGTYTVVLDSEPAGPVTVTPEHSSGDSDVSVSAALSFTASTWATPQTVTVSAGEDADALDDTAVIGHMVSGADYGGVGAASVMVTVDDDETDPTGVTLSVSPDAVSEGAGATTVTVTAALNGGSRGTATEVTVTVGSGTAVSDTDFTAVTGFTLTIAANQVSTTGTFRLTPSNDTVDEPDETVEVSGATTASGFTVTDATLTITDNDATPTVTLALSNPSISENVGVSTVTATLSHASSEDTTVTVSVSPVSDSDYRLSLNTVLTIAAEATSSSGTVTITAVNNDVDAVDRMVTVRGAVSNTLNVSDPTNLSLTITDDDVRGVTVSAAMLSIAEGGTGTYTVVLDSEPAGQVTVTPAHSSGDSGVSVSAALSFTASTWNTLQTVTVSAGEDLDAVDGTAVIGHTVSGADYGGVSAASVRVTVDDDETVSTGVTLSVSPGAVSEGAGATTVTVTAALNGGSRSTDTAVTVTVGSGAAVSDTDFMAVTGFTITIAADQVSGAGTFSLMPTNDTVDEPNETVSITGLSGSLTVTPATVTIIDNEGMPTVTLVLSSASISESSGVNTVTVTATLSHASSVDTTVTVSVSPVSNSDYGLSANMVLTIAAETTASTGAVTITAVDNDVDAGNKMVTVRGAASNTLNVTDPTDLILTITDDDTRGVTVSQTGLEIGEGGTGTGTYTVVLDSEPTGQVTVTPEHSGDSDVSVTGPLNFTTGNWATLQTVTVSAGDDLDAVDDTAVIGHMVSGADYGGVAAATVTVTVDDNETVSTRVTLSVSPDAVSEGAGATTVTVTAELNGGSRSTDTAVTVTVGSGTAVSGTDFEAVTGFSITIAANSLSQTGAFSLRPAPDTVDEPDETVRVSGATTVPGFTVTDATLTITDNDAAPAVTLALSSTSISENGGISTVTASLDHASSEDTTVTVSAAPVAPASSSDYSLSANTVLTIAAGATASSGTVTVTGVNNHVDAENKMVTVMGAASNDLDVSGPGDHSLTITDDDVRGVTVSAAMLSIAEGGTGTYTVVLDSEPAGQVTVTPAHSSGDSDVSVSAALSFTASTWNTLQTVTVSAGEDLDALDDTAVIGHTVSGADYGGVTAATVTVTVDDNETVSTGVTLSVSPDAVSEGADATTVTVTAALNGGSRTMATEVTVTVGSGTAVSDTDFMAVTGFTLTIAADQVSTTGTFRLTPSNDTVDEPDETVEVSGATTASGFTVTDATLTITDNDATPTVTLALSNPSISENVGVSTVTATLSHASSEDTTVTVSVEAMAPASGLDYSLSANTVLTIAAEATASSGTVTVTGVNNDVDAANKTVTVMGAASNNLGVSDPNDLRLIIANDDVRGVTVSAAMLSIAEGGTGTYTVVLDSEPAGEVTVTPARSSGDSDVSVSVALNFTALTWATPQTVTVSAGEDTDALDDTAVIGHMVSGADYGGVTAATVTVTVDDNETVSTRVTLSVSPDAVSEGAGATTVTVTAALNGGSRSTDTAVSVTVGSGTAVSGTDFAMVPGFTITIAANSLSQTGAFSLRPDSDMVDEPNETVRVSGATTVPGFTVTDAEVEITDDDAAPAVTLALSSTSISENGGTSTVTASLNHASSEDTTVTVSAAPASSSDYSLSANTVLTIAAGATASSGTVTITARNNEVDAPDKTVTVSGRVTAGRATSPSDETLTITDDEVAPAVTLVLAPNSISEKGGVSTVTATLSHVSARNTVITVLPAVAGDFSLSENNVLLIEAGLTGSFGTVTVTAVDNEVDAPNKVVTVSAEAVNELGVTGPDMVPLTITDDDTASTMVTLTVLPDEVVEDGGAKTLTVTGTLNGATRVTQTVVTLAVEDVTATVTDDYTAAGATLTIAARQASASATLTLTPQNDEVAEGPETVRIGGTVTVSGLTVAPAPVTIIDDEGTPTVTLALSSTSISENGGTSTVTASLSNVSSGNTVVTVSAAAVSPAVAADFTLSGSTTLTIAASSTSSSGTVTITANNNNTVDAPDKEVTMSGSVTGDVTAPADMTLTITDDEAAPEVTLVLMPDPIGESGGVSTVTARLDHASSEDTTVTVSAVAVHPALAADFTLAGSALSIAAGSTSSSGTVTITGVNNDVDAQDKSVTVSAAAVNNYRVTAPDDRTLTITDDDDASITVILTVAPQEVAENGGAKTLTVTGTLDAGTRVEDTVVTLAVEDGTAQSADYAAAGATLTIAAKQASASATLTLTPVNDSVAEGAETVRLGGYTASGLTVTPVHVTIIDDEDPEVTLVLTPASIAESAGVSTVTARLSHASSGDTIVTVSAVAVAPALSGDFSLSMNRTLSITAGSTTSSGTVIIIANNNMVDAPNKGVTVSAVAVNQQGVTDPANRTLTITDDEEPPVAMLELSPGSIDENGGISTVTAKLSHASVEDTTVTVAAAAVAPAVAGDFSLSMNRTLTIASGSTSSSGTVKITAVNNEVDAPNKSVKVSAGVVNGLGVTAPSDVTLTITDDEEPPEVTLVLTPGLIGESGGISTVTAALSHASSEDTVLAMSAVAVHPALAEDFRLGSGLLSIAAGSTSSSGTVTITAVDNEVDAPEKEVTVSAVAINRYRVMGPADRTLIITDDDDASTEVILTVAPARVDEDAAAAVTLMVTGTLNAGTRTTETVVTLAVEDETATLTDDYTAAGATLTIAAKQASATATLSFMPEDDVVAEGPETVSIGGTVTVSGLMVASAQVTIIDNEGTPEVTLALSNTSITEAGGSSTVTARLSLESREDTTVTVSAAPVGPASGLDYSLSGNTTLTIAANSTTSSGTVTITANNNNTVDAPDKEVTVSGSVTGGTGAAAPADVPLTITDDEAAPKVTLALTPASIGENGGVSTVTARLDHASSEDTTVTVSALAVLPALAADFSLGGGSLHIAAGSTTSGGTVTITANNNDVDAPDKTVTVSAVAVNNYRVTAPDDRPLTITDDDIASTEVRLTVAPAEVPENGGVKALTVTGTLNAGTRTTEAVVTLAVVNGTAQSADYSATGAMLTIGAKQASATATLTLAPVNDVVAEGAETVNIVGTVSGLMVTPVAVTIIDDEGRPTVTLELSPGLIDENGGFSTVTAKLSHASGVDTTVTVAAAAVAPAVAGDFSLSMNRTLTIASGSTSSSGTVKITALNNEVDALEKRVMVSAGVVNGLGVTEPSDVLLIITDDEPPPEVTLVLTPDLDRGEWRDQHGDGDAEPRLERGHGGDGLGGGGGAGGVGRLQSERQYLDDFGGRNGQHRDSDDHGEGQHCGCAGQGGDGFGGGGQRLGSDGAVR